jgi:protein TonB
MAAELFEDIVDPSTSVGTRQWYTVPLSILAHAVALAGLVVVPLVAAGMLPTPESVLVFTVTPASPPPAPPPVTIHERTVAPEALVNSEVVPLDPPSIITPEPQTTAYVPIPGVIGGSNLKGLPESTPTFAALPEAAPLYVRPGGAIKEPRKVRDVAPVYPAIAISARAEGQVIIEAIISKEGDVVDATVQRSQPLLDRAALDAVRQWKYTPTLLNGVPVEVHMSVMLNFKLH